MPVPIDPLAHLNYAVCPPFNRKALQWPLDACADYPCSHLGRGSIKGVLSSGISPSWASYRARITVVRCATNSCLRCTRKTLYRVPCCSIRLLRQRGRAETAGDPPLSRRCGDKISGYSPSSQLRHGLGGASRQFNDVSVGGRPTPCHQPSR